MTGLKVFAAIASVVAGLSEGIAKNRYNRDQDYWYRSIDDLTTALSPLLAKHRLCLFPKVRKHKLAQTSDGATKATVRLELEFVSARDGSRHCVEMMGEAIDSIDKATAKAISAAYKQVLLLTFCVPCEEADAYQILRGKTALKLAADVQDPDQGWEQWTDDLKSLIDQCESIEAVHHVRKTYATQLRACSLRSSEHFKQIGKLIDMKRRSFLQVEPDLPVCDATAPLAKTLEPQK